MTSPRNACNVAFGAGTIGSVATRIAIELSDADLAVVDAAIDAGRYADRVAALRAGLTALLRRERDVARDLEGYRQHPQDREIGEASVALLAEALEADGDHR